MRLTSSSDAQLLSALKDLNGSWAATCENWRDKARNDFEKNHVAELAPAVLRTVADIRELNQLLRQAINDCR